MESPRPIAKGRLAEVFAWPDSQVVKLFSAGRDIELIEAEARASQLVYEAGLATPRMHGIVEFEGRTGIVFDRVYGNPMLKLLSTKPWKLRAHGRLLAELHLAIHRRRVDELPPQREQLDHLITRARLPDRQRRAAQARLHELPDGTAVCHGDFHPDNILVGDDVATVIDWTTASIGNPVADYLLTSLILRLGAAHPGAPLRTRAAVGIGRSLFHWSYTSRYRRLGKLSASDVEPWVFPVAVARLGYDVAAERRQLLTLIDRAAVAATV